MQQRIPWLVIAVLGVAVAWLGWQNLELRARAETREVQRRRELGELEARLEAARRVTPARLSAIELDPDAASARDAVPAAPEPEQPVVDVESWRARLAQAPDDGRHGLAVIQDLVELPPDQALALFRELWPTMSVPHKEQSLKPFIPGGHEHALAVLDLAARDEALSVQERAFGYLEEIAFADFSLDYNEYLAFADRFAGAPPRRGAGLAHSHLPVVETDRGETAPRGFALPEALQGEAPGLDKALEHDSGLLHRPQRGPRPLRSGRRLPPVPLGGILGTT